MHYPTNSMFNRMRFVFDKHLRMANITEASSAAYGDAEAFATDGDISHLQIDDGRLTYRQVHEIVARLAQLLKQAGLSRFARVAIYKHNSVDYFLMALAVMRAGGIAVPVHGRMKPADFTHYANYCGCEMVFTDASNLSQLNPADFPKVKQWIIPTVQDHALETQLGESLMVLAQVYNNDLPLADAIEMNAHDDALIVHTSGTTGFPKGVLHSSYSLIRACRAQLILNPFPRGERVIAAAHQNHHISFTGLQLGIMAGIWNYVATDHTPKHLLEVMQEQQASVFFAFPDIYQALYREGMHNYDLSTMQAWFSGGDAMHEVHIRACVDQGHFALLGIKRKGSLFFELLGTSEVGSAALTKISTRKTEIYSRCVGKPTFVGPKVKVADALGNPLPKGEVGRLMVKGPTVFKGYWNLHEKLHGVVVDGWWWTGDMARQDDKGRYYQIDREVDVVHSSQGPVYGLPLEEELLKCNDVAEATIIGVDHPAVGVVPVAIAHSLSGNALDTEAIKVQVNALFPQPQHVFDVIDVGSAQGIPRGLTGKILKRHLRDQFAQHYHQTQAEQSAEHNELSAVVN